jgi:hypothetical protein
LILVLLGLPVLWVGCGYGKDTGPKAPKPSAQFEPLVDRFVERCKSCYEHVFQVNLGRQLTAPERADANKQAQALKAMRTELLQCLTGKGYGNEVQLEASVVEVWLAKTGCPQFASASFKAPQCIAIQSVLEEAGYSPDAPQPPKRPPVKKRPPTSK